MSWLNPWYWWQTPEDKEDDKPVEPEKKHMYQVTEGVEIDTSKIWLCPELLKLKKKTLKETTPVQPPTPEDIKIKRQLKNQKIKLRRKNRKRKRSARLDLE